MAWDLLRELFVTIAAAARRVGYVNASALSVAVTRLRPHAPRSI